MGVWDAAIRRIADPVVRELAARGRIRNFAEDSLLIREAEFGDALFVILEGAVKVYVSNAQGREKILRHYGRGDYVGEMALDGHARSASVQALEPTVCAVVLRTDLVAAIRANPEVALRMLGTAMERARNDTVEIKNLALLDVYGRVARLLLSLPAEVGADGLTWTKERLTQQEIASRVGASRDMVSRILKDLRTGGYIEIREKRITILRRPPARW